MTGVQRGLQQAFAFGEIAERQQLEDFDDIQRPATRRRAVA